MRRDKRVSLVARLVPMVLALGMSVGSAAAQSTGPHSAHAMPVEQTPAGEPLPPFIPTLTDDDRKAAFPDVDGHPAQDQGINYFVLFDQLEWETGTVQAAFGWDTKGWVGRDRDRLWLRTEGQRSDGDVWDAQTHAFYGRQVSRWWDVLAGVRQDLAPGPAQTWAAFGVQGLAPYWFDVEAPPPGRGGTESLPFREPEDHSAADELPRSPAASGDGDLRQARFQHDRDCGLATLDFGVRLRYLVQRDLAPYAGVVWHQKHSRHRRHRARQRREHRRRAIRRRTSVLVLMGRGQV